MNSFSSKKKFFTPIINLLVLFINNIDIKANEIDQGNMKKKVNKEQIKYKTKISDKETNMKWEIVKDKSNKIKWELIKKKTSNNSSLKAVKNISNKKFENKKLDYLYNSLQLGKSVTTANTLSKGTVLFETSHVSTFQDDEQNGIGNQNYSGMIQYGFNEDLTISSFYTEADDPLFTKIISREVQPENLWSIYGCAIKWKILSNERINLAIETSLERWRIGSGGCFGYGCKSNSNNIFNYSMDQIINDNLVGSISFPITYRKNNNIEYTISPKAAFIPSKQGNSSGYSDFYGINYGIGGGFVYKINKKLKPFISSYIPIGSSKNSFNKYLEYEKKIIYTVGLKYILDRNIALEGYLTNSFGQTPTTSILTIPSSNEVLYSGRFIYTPRNKNTDMNLLTSKEITNTKKKRKDYRSYSIKKGEKIFTFGNSKYGRLYNLRYGLSDLFDFEINSEEFPNFKTNNKYIKKYMDPSSNILRGGGTAKIFSQDNNDLFTSSIRLTYGRSMGETRPGYLFSEIINEFNINRKLSIKISPKAAHTGDGYPIAIETGLNWNLSPRLNIIPKVNIALNDSETNTSLVISKKLNKNINVDSEISNSIGTLDMGQLFKTEDTNYRIQMKIKI